MTAHCEQVFSGIVRVGALCTGFSSITNCGQDQEEFNIEDYWIHPDFDDDTLQNDFAIVKLDGKSSITPVSIDNGEYSPTYTSSKPQLYQLFMLLLFVVLLKSRLCMFCLGTKLWAVGKHSFHLLLSSLCDFLSIV